LVGCHQTPAVASFLLKSSLSLLMSPDRFDPPASQHSIFPMHLPPSFRRIGPPSSPLIRSPFSFSRYALLVVNIPRILSNPIRHTEFLLRLRGTALFRYDPLSWRLLRVVRNIPHARAGPLSRERPFFRPLFSLHTLTRR